MTNQTPEQKFVGAMRWLWLDHCETTWKDADHSTCGGREQIRAACEAYCDSTYTNQPGLLLVSDLIDGQAAYTARILKAVFDD